jgi:competence protein ComEC
VYYASLAVALVRLRRRTLRTAAALVAGAAGLWIVAPARPPRVASPAPPGQLRVVFLDVGQGDATLLQFPTGESMLVDAGGTPGARFDVGAFVTIPALWALGVRRLDYVVITHGDPDHAGGAAAVIGDFRPREVWEGPPVADRPDVQAVAAAARAAGAVHRRLAAGDAIVLGGVRVSVLWPPDARTRRRRVENDDSLVLAVRWDDTSVILPGDVGARVERRLAASAAASRILILKAAHHGSATSTSAAWLDALQPSAVVASAGPANRYGHPAPDVLARLAARRIHVLRTDRHGAVFVHLDGRSMTVMPYVPAP